MKTLSYLLVLSLLTITQLSAKNNDISSNLPKLLGANNQGTEFFLTFHPAWETNGSDNAIKVYVASACSTAVTLEIPALGYTITKVTKPNDVVDFTLDPELAQCYRKTNNDRPMVDQVFQGKAIIITSVDPIICYGVVRYSANSDGFLALPKNTLGTDYIVSSYPDLSKSNEPNKTDFYTSYTSIIAAFDNTKIKFTLGGNNSTTTELGLKPGDTDSKILNKGDVWLIPGKGNFGDLSGSIVNANKPVAVISGNFCAYVPINYPACDYLIEQELPMNTWGKEYYLSAIIDRKINSWIRVYAKEPYTKIMRNGNQIAMIETVGGINGKGYLDRYAANGEKQSFVISGDKPIYVHQYNPGQSTDNVESDPFQLVLTPIEQFQNEIIFNTPGINDGLNFRNNYINVVYRAEENGNIPDDLLFGKNVNGDIAYQKFSTLVSNSGEQFKDSYDQYNRPMKTVTYRIPNDGVYKIKSTKSQFTAYAYGFDKYDSYGFPTSLSIADIESQDSIPPQPHWTIDCFGNVPAEKDKSSDAYVIDWGTDPAFPPNDLDKTSNLSYIQLIKEESDNYIFKYKDFVAGVDIYTEWSLEVDDLTKDAKAVILFSDKAGNDTTIEINYYTTNLDITPKVLNFGDFIVGDPPITKQLTVTNTSTTNEVFIDDIFFQEANECFSCDLINFNINAPLSPLESRTLDITFTPIEENCKTNTLVLDAWSNAKECMYAFQADLEATTGNPRIYAEDFNFYQTIINQTTQYIDVNISNRSEDGSTNQLKITNVNYSENVGDEGSNKNFEIIGLDGIDENNPLIIDLDESYTFQVRFTPDSIGDFSGRIDYISDAKNDETKPYTLLYGKGTALELYSNNANWNKQRVKLDRYPIDNQYYNLEFPYNSSQALVYSYGNSIIDIMHNGINNIILSTPKIIEDINGSAFKVYQDLDGDGEYEYVSVNNNSVLEQMFKGKELKPGEHYITPLYFLPEESDFGAGEHKLVIEFESDANDNPVTTIEGTGVYPIIVTEPEINFAETIIGADPVSKQITFKNKNWEWQDTLTIYDIEVVNTGEISEDIGNFGTEFFTYDKNAINFPVKLSPGQELTFSAYFQPQEIGEFSGQIITVSDAFEEVMSTWKGSAVSQSVETSGDEVSICKGENPVLISTYKNTGTSPLSVNISLTSDEDGNIPYTGSDFKILNSVSSFTIEPRQTQEIEIEYSPEWESIESFSGSPKVFLKYENNSFADKISTALIKVDWEGYPRKSYGKVNGEDEITLKLGSIDSSKFTYSLFLSAFGLDMVKAENEMNTNEIYVSLEYDTKFMSATGISDDLNYLTENILSDMLYNKGYKITEINRYLLDGNNTDEYKMEKIDLTISGGNTLTEFKKIPILEAEFSIFLPSILDYELGQYIIDGNDAEIIHTIHTDNEPCVEIEETSFPNVIREEVCVDNLRKIVLIPNFNLSAIEPNPVGNNGGRIDFEVGFETYTSVKIYSLSGELISQPVNEILKPGKYSLTIPVEELPSGVYFYEMCAGQFKDVKKMIIKK